MDEYLHPYFLILFKGSFSLYTCSVMNTSCEIHKSSDEHLKLKFKELVQSQEQIALVHHTPSTLKYSSCQLYYLKHQSARSSQTDHRLVCFCFILLKLLPGVAEHPQPKSSLENIVFKPCALQLYHEYSENKYVKLSFLTVGDLQYFTTF